MRLSVCSNDGPFSGESFKALRSFKSIKLIDDKEQNRNVLDEIRAKLNQLKIRKDTLNGIDIVFDDNTSYQDFITVVDICRERKPYTFASAKNHIYAFYVDTTKSFPLKLK